MQIGPVNVAPVGWRRTTNGWERAETWSIPDQDTQAVELRNIISRQQFAERSTTMGAALSSILRFVRRIDPVTLACSQVTLLALYIALVFHRESKAKELPCPSKIPPSP